jgi:flagellar protein FliS
MEPQLMTAYPAQARARYETMAYTSRIEGATPHELVALLYEELILALTLLAHAFRVGDSVKANGQFSRAATIINALEGGLDVERGGPLAETLAGVYRSARREIMQARTDQDYDRLDRLIAAFADMSESWKKIAA